MEDLEALPSTINMSVEEFTETLKLGIDRSKTSAVFGYERPEDVDQRIDRAVALVEIAFGELVFTDFHTERTRTGGKSSVPLYSFLRLDRWPEGLYEKAVNYTWAIDRPHNILDSIARKV